ncbi:MAG: hypothetical protein KKB74_00515 [Bacteroidetes bacterium]|nr:hypothetical protein [Bacteroidota bacterium]
MIAEIIKYSIPSLVMLAAVYVMLRFFLKHDEHQLSFLKEEQDLTRLKLDMERKRDSQKVIIPLKLQAYERMVLFLERISPPNLIKRSMSPGQKVTELQGTLLHHIREEYEHNMSQQLYIGENSWEMVKTAKEEVARLINTSAAKFKTDDEAALLAKELLTTGFDTKNDPIEKTLAQLKKEVRDNF